MEINFPFFFFFLTFAYRKQCSGLSLAFRYWRARGKSGQHRASHFRNSKLLVTVGVGRRKEPPETYSVAVKLASSWFSVG